MFDARFIASTMGFSLLAAASPPLLLHNDRIPTLRNPHPPSILV